MGLVVDPRMNPRFDPVSDGSDAATSREAVSYSWGICPVLLRNKVSKTLQPIAIGVAFMTD